MNVTNPAYECARNLKDRTHPVVVAILFSFVVAACGGGGGGGGGSSSSGGSALSLSGISATGLAIAGRTVTVKCATGATQTTTTAAAGTFSVSVPSGAGPCVAEVDATSLSNGHLSTTPTTRYHGYISANEIVSNAGTINITPLTDEVLRLALNNQYSPGVAPTPQQFFDAASVSTIPGASLTAGETAFLSSLPTGVTLSAGLRTTTFTAATSYNSATNADPVDSAMDLLIANNGTYTAPTNLTVSVSVTDPSSSGGSVASNVGGITACDKTKPSTCTSAAVGSGTSMTLTATVPGGYAATWGGACSGASGNTCNLTVNSAKAVGIRFDPTNINIWWVSTTGSDSNNGHTQGTAFATFHKALTMMAAGDTLYIDDGTYHESIGGFGGAYSRWDNSACASYTAGTPPCADSGASYPGARVEGPSGTSSGARTKILGYNPHAVFIDASTAPSGKKIGLQIFKGQHIEVGNIVFMHTPDQGPVHIEQANDIYIHDVGAAFPDPTSASDNNRATFFVGDSKGVVIQDSWGWGFGGRYGVVFHGGSNNVVRRNVFRYDGSPDGQPKAGVTLYSETNSIAENNIVIDFDNGTDSTGDVHAPLFSTCSVTLSAPSISTGLGTIGWYGNMAINTIGQTNANFFFDSLCSIGGTVTVKDNVVQGVGGSGGTTVAGMWFSNDSNTHLDAVVSHNTIYNSNGRGVRVDATPRWNSLSFNDNLIDAATGQCFQDMSGSGARITAANNQVFGCTTTTVPNDATLITTDPTLLYLPRIETGATGKGTGSGGTDRGATIANRYVNGSLTGTALWPFPNETYIKADMCQADTGGANEASAAGWTSKYYTRGHGATGWCGTAQSLTQYIWRQLGNSGVY